jgi:hypothetical protein
MMFTRIYLQSIIGADINLFQIYFRHLTALYPSVKRIIP